MTRLPTSFWIKNIANGWQRQSPIWRVDQVNKVTPAAAYACDQINRMVMRVCDGQTIPMHHGQRLPGVKVSAQFTRSVLRFSK